MSDEIAIGIGDFGLRIVDARVGGADTGAVCHRNGEKQAFVTGKKSEHAVMLGNLWHDQVNSFRQQVMVVGVDSAALVVIVDKSTGRINQDFRANVEAPAADLILDLGRPATVSGAHREITREDI